MVMGDRTVVHVSAVSPPDCWVDEELQLAVPAQHHERGLDHILPPGKRPKFKIQSTVSTEYASLLHHGKV